MAREYIVSGDTAGGTRRAASHYGRRTEQGGNVSEYNNNQNQRVQTTTFRFDELPAATLDELHQRIPAGSRVVSTELRVTESFTGAATIINVGLSTPDGTTYTAPKGLVGDTEGVIANYTEGYHIDGAGLLIGSLQSVAQDVQVTVTADGALTAGEATLIVTYEVLTDRKQQMNG